MKSNKDKGFTVLQVFFSPGPFTKQYCPRRIRGATGPYLKSRETDYIACGTGWNFKKIIAFRDTPQSILNTFHGNRKNQTPYALTVTSKVHSIYLSWTGRWKEPQKGTENLKVVYGSICNSNQWTNICEISSERDMTVLSPGFCYHFTNLNVPVVCKDIFLLFLKLDF